MTEPLLHQSDRARLEAINAEIDRLYREGRDREAYALEIRANALARKMFRELAA